MDTLVTKILHGINQVSLYIAIFLVPLFFLPYTVENLELNKNFLFYFLTILSLLCWLGRAVIRKNLEIRRTPLDLPLLILWFLYFLTSLLSQETYLSFFGDFSSLGLSFISLTCLLIFYFLLVQNLSGIKQILTALYLILLSGALAALYFIIYPALPSLMNFFASFSLIQNPAAVTANLQSWLPKFNLLHASNTLAGIFFVIIFVLALSLLTIRKKNFWLDFFFFLIFLLSGAALVMPGFKLIWIVVALAIFLMLIFFLTYLERVKSVWTSISFAVLVIALLFIFLGVPRFLTASLPVEVSLGGNVSASIVYNTVIDGARSFLFGSGPATFVFDFSKYRPADFNNNFAWDIRFRQPYSGALDWAATTGVLGTLSFLFIILMVLGLIVSTWLRHLMELRRKKKPLAEETEKVAESLASSPLIFWALVGAWLILLISFFLVNFGMAHWLLFWLLLGLMIGASAHLAKAEMPTLKISLKISPQYMLASSFAFILIFTAIMVAGIYLGRYFAGEIVFARALSQPAEARLDAVTRAVALNPNRVLFYLTQADLYFNKATELANKTNDVNQVAPLVASAVQAAKIATDKAPNNVATWEYLSSMYANARPIAPEANNWTITALERAVSLEPTNPLFYVASGDAKLVEKRYSEAKDDYEKAISLKSNLLNAYIRLAFLKETQNDLNGAVAAMEKGLNYGLQDAGYVFQIGRYYFNRNQKNDMAQAEAAFRRAIALNPNYSDALYALGLLYERNGNKGPALDLYRRVLNLNPGNKDIRKKVDSLSGAS